jgi:hypothetical protein
MVISTRTVCGESWHSSRTDRWLSVGSSEVTGDNRMQFKDRAQADGNASSPHSDIRVLLGVK